ncbi:uncharacterized protein STEHIDRAFT_99442 [Stereum hirsutum FP-91666 SS1]|uniref:uncharacterized protein n=1 Tax=Stereum hirsutum (strain FP-91666) TaxID=721885 RepID=UPI000444941E|nr:uncharacterized protein STEHIDRAFT_99442 [Stereum hirsutum FP-91666 SS1]EIM85727.1 hypothetical protein STEHIDRAFT_99442 [Stereum hirsutum FP-91666 SS1]
MVMVEPVLASINSLLAYPVPLRPALAHSAFRSLSASMHPQSYNAVSSRSKRAKGKQRALPDTDWFTDSQWLTHNHCSKRVSPFPDPPESPIRHRIQTHLRHPTRPSLSPSSSTIIPAFRSPCRVHVRYASDSTLLATRKALPVNVFDHFVRDQPIKGHPVLLDEAWRAFETLRDQNNRSISSHSTLSAFVDRALTEVENTLLSEDDSEQFQEWMERLQPLVDELGSTAKLRHQQQTFHCLSARCLALSADTAAALAAWKEFKARKHRRGFDPMELRMINTLVHALDLHGGPERVLDFVAHEYETVGTLVLSQEYRSGRSKTDLRSGPDYDRLCQTVFLILDRIEFPAVLVANRREIGSEMRRKNVGVVLVLFLIHRRAAEDAVAVCEEMYSQRLELPHWVTLRLIRSLVRNNAFEMANTLFARVNNSLPPEDQDSVHVLSAGLHLFSHQGDIQRTEQYFEAMKARVGLELPAINMLLQAHAVNGDATTVVQLFRTYFPDSTADTPDQLRPNIIHYSTLILAHANARDFVGMNNWLQTMIDAGFAPDQHVYGLLIQSFASRGELETVASIMDQMREAGLRPSAATYTTVISMLSKRKDPVAAEAMYKRAIREGIFPDRHMIAALMTAHMEAGSYRGVIRAFDYLVSSKDRHLRPRIGVYNILLKSYVLLSAPFEIVSGVFSRMEKAGLRPTVHTFAILMQAACVAGRMEIAVNIFNELERLAAHWETGLHINVYALTLLMSGYLRLGDKIKAKEVYDMMLERGIQPTSMTYGSILRAYAQEGTEESLELAKEFLKSLMSSEPKDRTWLYAAGSQRGYESIYAPVMAQLGRLQRPEDVEDYFQEIIEAGGEPTLPLLTLLLNAYRVVGNIPALRQVWSQILRLGLRHAQVDSLFASSTDSSERPRLDLQRQANVLCVPLSIYIDALSVAGYHDDAAEVWAEVKSHGFAFDSHNWNHLVVVLVRAGEPERAFQVVERVILPYQRQTAKIVAERDDNPSSPLTFDDEIPWEELSPDVDKPLRANMNPKNRPAATRVNRRQVGSELAMAAEERPNDFAHPLHILQQVYPSWNLWRPHGATMSLLGMVLNHLESGRLVQPVMPPEDVRRWKQEVGDEAEVAEEVLVRILENCPETVSVVRSFEDRLRGRAAMSEFIRERRGNLKPS